MHVMSRSGIYPPFCDMVAFRPSCYLCTMTGSGLLDEVSCRAPPVQRMIDIVLFRVLPWYDMHEKKWLYLASAT